MLAPPFPFVGGKARQAKWIAGHIDATPHSAYVEACCGSAAVFFAKQRSKIEVLNDKDRRFPLLYQALRDHPEKVIKFCHQIEYSKAAFDESYHHLRGNPDGIPDWKLGAWALYQCIASHSGYPDGHSFAWRVIGQNPARSWLTKIKHLVEYATRLKGCVFTNYDVLTLLKRVDRSLVLIYTDPPYFGAEYRYKVTKGEFDHEALARALKALSAKVIVSHYFIEPYISLYSGWRVETRASNQSCKGSTKHSPEEDKPVVEALWFNYPHPTSRFGPSQSIRRDA